MKKLLSEIRSCTVCAPYLPHGVRPIVQLHPNCRILIVGQAPGRKVHQSGIPWNDKSGETLRRWMNISKEEFYDPKITGILPMGFCYPGKGVSGDLPPRAECALQWHNVVNSSLKKVKLTLLVGSYAQKYYLGKKMKLTTTETVHHFKDYLPEYFPIIHPSPRNGIWQKKNPWFIKDVVPELQEIVQQSLYGP